MIEEKTFSKLHSIITTGLIVCGILICCTIPAHAQDADDYFLGNGFTGNGDTVFTNSGTFWDDGYDTNYDQNGSWDVYFCTTTGNPNPLTLEFSGFKTHYGGATIPGPYQFWDYINAEYPGANYFVYNDDTPEFSLTSQNGCIHITMYTNGDTLTDEGWQAEIYAIPPPVNNEPCGASFLEVGNVCTPQVFSNKGAYSSGSYASPCHNYFGGDIWFSAVVPPSGNLKIESFPGTLEWAVMNLYRGSSCTGLTHFECIEDSIGMPTAFLDAASIPGLSVGDTVFIRMFGDQAKSGTFGMCASDPTSEIEGKRGPGGVGDDSTNVIWLRGDMGTLNSSDLEASDGEGVKTWQDRSGNGNDVTQSSGSLQPLLASNIIDGMPGLRFDGTDDYLRAELSSLSAPLTLITVSRFTGSGADNYLMSMGDEISDIKTVSISRESDDRYYTFSDNAKWYGPALTTDTAYLLNAGHNIASTYHELYINETAQSPSDYSTSVVTDGSLKLGTSRDTTDFLTGDIAEFIIYNQTLNTAQKIIVENSLAAKYGISIATDRYEHAPSHRFDVAGIGQVDGNNQHTEAQSARTLSIGNPTDLDDSEFLFFGHDNGEMSSWTGTERPNNDPDVQRIEREWKIDITGDPGALTITLSDSILPDLIPGFSDYILWSDADGDFSSGATEIPLVKGEDDYVANTVILSDNSYITIGAVIPVVSFVQDSSEAIESVEFPDMVVSLNYPLNEEVSVVFRAIDGTATGGGVDYLLNPGSATFAAGATSTIIQPMIVDDTIVEIPDEYIYIRLSDPDPGLILSADSNHTFTILNNDINVAAASTSDTLSDCGSTSANLSTTVEGTGPYTYSWVPAAGLSDTAVADPAATPSANTWYKVTVTDQTNGAVGMDSLFITVFAKPPKPNITTGGVTTFCDGDSVQLTASTGYSWLWSNGESTQAIQAKTSGNYTVKNIDQAGCESDPSDAETVTVNAIPSTPIISASGNTDLCPGDSVDLSSTDGDNYLWSTGAATKSIRVKNAGLFFVQTQSSEGCKSDTSLTTAVTIKTPPAAPTISASGPTDICPGDSVDLEASAGSTWLWSNGATTRIIRVKSAGSFSVRVTDATGCLSSASADTDVTVKTPPAAPTITPSGPTDFCPGDSVDLQASAGSTWLWSNGETTQTIRVKSAGSFTVQITDGTGCLSDSSVVTNVSLKTPPAAPAITPSGPTGFCPGDSVDLEASSGSTWLWSNGETTQTIRVKAAGDFSVQVTDASTCISPPSTITSVSLYSVPSDPVITAGGDTDICENDSVSLNSSAGSAYLWSTGDTTGTLYAKSAGSYTVQVFNTEGCQSPPSPAIAVTTQAAPAIPTITLGGSDEFCEGDSAILTSSAGSNYLWSTSETSQSITVKTSDSYTVRVANAIGCLSLESLPAGITVNPLPTKPVISGDIEFCTGDSVQLTSSLSDSYLWSNGATTASVYAKAGSYTVTVTDEKACTSAPSDSHTVTENSLPPKPAITGSESYCQGDSVQLSGPAATSWTWSTAESGQTIYATAGSYTLTITDANGCESPLSDPKTVTGNPIPGKPSVTAEGPTDIWLGDSVVLSSGDASVYLWSPGGESTKNITVRTAGSYSVVISDANGCTSEASDPVTVSVNSLSKPVVTVAGNTEFCEGTARTSLTSSEAFSYLWSTGETTRTIEPQQTGSYSVIIFDNGGHQSEPSDPQQITIYSNPSASLLSKTDLLCQGLSTGAAEAMVTGGTEPYAYLWTSQQTTAEASGLSAGIHTFTVTDANRCTDSLQVIIFEPDALDIVETIDQPYCDDSYNGNIEIQIHGGTPSYSILWTDGSSGTTVEDLGPITIGVEISDANQCTETESYTLSSEEDFCVTIPEIITPNNDGFNDTWRMPGIEYYPEATVEVYDRWGKQVFYTRGYDDPWDGRSEGKILPMASYHYIIDLGNGSPRLVGNITIMK